DDVITDLRAGRMVILTDDEDRENEGDLVLPAPFATPEAITFMLSVARGYLCLSLTESDCDRLDLAPQASRNTSARGTAFTVSIDGHPRHGFTTGVSASERARTILMAIDRAYGPGDFVRPGHINPLRSRDGGVLVRIGQTEGSLDLCRLAGLYPAALIIEIMNDDGEMARLAELSALARDHNLRMCSVRQIIEHRLSRSGIVRRLDPVGGRAIRTPEGEFRLFAFRSVADSLPHLALTVGGVGAVSDDGTPIETPEPTLVRVHRRDLLGDIFLDLDSSAAGATGSMLRSSMRMIQREGRGAIVYLRPRWSGEDWRQDLQRPFDATDEDRPHKSVSASMLESGTGSQILRSLGLSRLRLITNSSAEYPKLDAFGLQIIERVGVEPGA
ncbi:MAG TPA: 3,4-dihydroxy-2-butanone-4-phosphate synthase, partial [Phycisphaerales bacterium]|nr:3,4-dihydroxy-2-butanone-4-phosphate synthase [Phycisphaerales bacterium]